jgi:AmmeMemoRadiSam system protein A
LTHYGRNFGYLPFPPDFAVEENLRDIDMGAMRAAASLNPALLEEELRKTGTTVCGREPIALLLETVHGRDGDHFAETFDYQTSGEITGDYGHSVSYGAMGIFPADSYRLGVEEQAELLWCARRSLDHYRRTGERPVGAVAKKSALEQRGRAFVTLYAEDKVRGCVGCFENPVALRECVPRLAASAMRDGRFGGIAPLEEVRIEVHILTPPRRIARPEELCAGLHGGFLQCEEGRGLLLPAVAIRHGMTNETFLRELAKKAGAAADVYRGRGWELSVFRDQVFAETRGAA